MKWIRTIFLLSLFVAATQVMPAVHAAECAGEHDKQHAPESCPVCAVMHAPMDTPLVFAMPAVVSVPSEAGVFFPPAPVSFLLPRAATQPRAPPAVSSYN